VVIMGVARSRRVGSGSNPIATMRAYGPVASGSDVRLPVECIECGIEYDNDPDVEEAYCPWCGARNPECVEWVAWVELQAAEEAAAG
jgi:hypothetical protein